LLFFLSASKIQSRDHRELKEQRELQLTQQLTLY